MKKPKTRNVFVSWHPSAPAEYESQDPKAQQAILELVEEASRVFAVFTYRQVNSGAVWTEDGPGKFAADLNTAQGLVKLRGATLAEGSSVKPKPEPHAVDAKCSGELWDELLGSDTPTGKKAEALACLIAEGAQEVIGFVLSQLGKEDLPLDWRDKLIFATEQLDVREPAQRETLKKMLYRHADSLLRSGRFQSESALWAAIRRYGSLVDESETLSMYPFLDGKSTIATRQVALQAIHSIFQQAPPKRSEGLSDLTARVHELASKYVDPDLLISPENTSLALNAVAALSSLGASSSVQIATKLKETGNRWLTRRAIQLLEAMLKGWEAGGEKNDNQKSAIRNVSESLAKLKL
jgi:hypothetical protein